MKGTDQRILTSELQQDIAQFVKNDPLQNSFLVYNSNEALRKLKDWKKNLSFIQPFYAIKSNPVSPLLEDLVGNGANLDCASRKEIEIALQNGLSPSQIVYSNPVKDEKELAWADQNGIQLTTADSIEELLKIQEYAPNMKILWRITIFEDNQEKLATVFSGKFGDDLCSLNEVEQRFQQIREMGIQLEGIHFHCGSGQHGSSSFKKAIDLAKTCMQLGRIHGHSMQTLDIGGGFAAGDLKEEFCQMIHSIKNDPLGYRVIAEPGRHFSSNSCYLFTRVLAKRTKKQRPCYHINDSVYHSFNCLLMDGVSFENQHDQFYSYINENNEINQINLQKSEGSIFGMTCDGHDVIAKNLEIPTNLNVGDWICLGGMGAYTYGPKSTFNGMETTNQIYKWSKDIQEKQIPQKKNSPLYQPSPFRFAL